jgi:hypothetical protein
MACKVATSATTLHLAISGADFCYDGCEAVVQGWGMSAYELEALCIILGKYTSWHLRQYLVSLVPSYLINCFNLKPQVQAL